MFKGEPTGLELLGEVRSVLEGLDEFDAGSLEKAIATFAEERCEGNLGRIAQPLRIAVSGGPVSPPIYDTLSILGRDSVLERVRRCIEALSDQG